MKKHLMVLMIFVSGIAFGMDQPPQSADQLQQALNQFAESTRVRWHYRGLGAWQYEDSPYRFLIEGCYNSGQVEVPAPCALDYQVLVCCYTLMHCQAPESHDDSSFCWNMWDVGPASACISNVLSAAMCGYMVPLLIRGCL